MIGKYRLREADHQNDDYSDAITHTAEDFYEDNSIQEVEEALEDNDWPQQDLVAGGKLLEDVS